MVPRLETHSGDRVRQNFLGARAWQIGSEKDIQEGLASSEQGLPTYQNVLYKYKKRIPGIAM